MATLRVNGQDHDVGDVDPTTPLLWVLRDHLGLTGTKYGCGAAQCGSCTVLYDGRPMRTCLLPLRDVGPAEITTIEGLSADGNHPLQRAWREHAVPQCGFCQPGQLMTAAGLLAANKDPDEQAVVDAMSGNICRCGTYQRIRAAVLAAARAGR